MRDLQVHSNESGVSVAKDPPELAFATKESAPSMQMPAEAS